MIKGSVTAPGAQFADAVKWTAKFLDSRPVAPIQGGLLLTAEGGQLSILGYNETLTARANIPIEGDGQGQTVVSGRLLAELAGTFPAKPVTIEGAEGASAVTVTVGSWRGTLPVMNAGDFPSPPPPPVAIGWVGGDAFAAMIKRVAAARSASPDAALRWHLLHLTFNPEGTAAAMATDSYRAAWGAIEFEGEEAGSALVNAEAVLGVAEAFAGPDQVCIGLDDGALGMASPSRAVIMHQTIDQEYPLEQVRRLFQAKHPQHATVNVKDLHAPMKRARIMRDKDGAIVVRFGDGVIALAAESAVERRAGEEEVPAGYSGPPWTLKFNPGYFADALATAPGETVDIELTTAKVSGVVITVPGNTDWRHLLMPKK